MRSGATPRFATPRTDRPTKGKQVINALRLLGYEPMPWQEMVADVAYEMNDDGSLAYREVILELPRQGGKTSLMLGSQVERALMWERPQTSFYTAQTRLHARLKFVDEHLEVLKQSPLRKLFKPRESIGSEGLLWKNGSRHSIGAPNAKAGHGGSLDLAQVDEAFALTDETLEQGLKPTMITRDSPQLWIVSAAGEIDTSHYLRSKMAIGRELVKLGVTDGTAYFEWSADDDMDSTDPATWWAVHPALGFTITEEALRADLQSMKIEEFERAYLCRWKKPSRTVVIERELWESRIALEPELERSPFAVAIDVSPDRKRSSLAVAHFHKGDESKVHVMIGRNEDGTSWLVPAVKDLIEATRNQVVFGFDTGSTAVASFLPEFERANVEVNHLKMGDVVKATGGFYDAVINGDLSHSSQVPLNEAVARAQKRKLSDAWAWARPADDDQSMVDITPLTAATLARYLLLTTSPGFDWFVR